MMQEERPSSSAQTEQPRQLMWEQWRLIEQFQKEFERVKQRASEYLQQSEERRQKSQREDIEEVQRSLDEVNSKQSQKAILFLVSDENALAFTTAMEPITRGVTRILLAEHTLPFW